MSGSTRRSRPGRPAVRRSCRRGASRLRAAAAGVVAAAQSGARRHRRAGAHARAADRCLDRRDDLQPSTTTSSTCSRPGSIAASWCCAASTGRRRRTCWRRSSATRPCMRSATGTICARRIDSPDRRCYAFFHPALVDEPLIFVEVALTRGIPAAIEPILSAQARAARARAGDDGGVLLDLQLPTRPRRRVVRPLPHQAGGRGDLPRNAAALDLRHALAGAEFRRMAQARARDARLASRSARRTARRSPALDRADWWRDEAVAEAVRDPLLRAAAWYFLRGRTPPRRAARFGRALSSRQWRPARAARLPRRHVGAGAAANRTA